MTPAEIERDTLDFVREMVTGGTPPALALIARHLRLTEAEARGAVDSLIAQGFLFRRDGRNRPLGLKGAVDVRTTSTDAMIDELRRRGVDVRLRERIASRGAKTCAIDTCGEPVRVGHLMCRRHWFLLPDAARIGLLRTSQSGEIAAFERLLTRARHLIATGEWRQAG